MFFSIFYSFWLCLEKQGAPTNRGCTIYYHSILQTLGRSCKNCSCSGWLAHTRANDSLSHTRSPITKMTPSPQETWNLELQLTTTMHVAVQFLQLFQIGAHIYAPICLMLLKVGFIVDVFPNIQGSCLTFLGRISAEQLLSVERVQYCPASV